MNDRRIIRELYLKKNIGNFSDGIKVFDNIYEKVFNLRYGTNPHQKAAYYRPVGKNNSFIGNMEILKQGKEALSQTNLEDIHYAIRILKYLPGPAIAIMKHGNPSGVAMSMDKDEQLSSIFHKAFQSDPRAAFGGVIVINRKVDSKTAEEIMKSVFEVIVAIDYDNDALDILKNYQKFDKNKLMRILKISFLENIPKYIDDIPNSFEIKTFEDGSLIVTEFFLSSIKSYKDLIPAKCEKCRIVSTVELNQFQLEQLLFSWYINFSVRSNGIVISKNNQTLAIGAGEQDRIGAIEEAILKAKEKYSGKEQLKGSFLSSDGFLPFEDSIELISRVGIAAIIQPGGSIRDCEIIQLANRHKIGMIFTAERSFSHH